MTRSTRPTHDAPAGTLFQADDGHLWRRTRRERIAWQSVFPVPTRFARWLPAAHVLGVVLLVITAMLVGFGLGIWVMLKHGTVVADWVNELTMWVGLAALIIALVDARGVAYDARAAQSGARA